MAVSRNKRTKSGSPKNKTSRSTGHGSWFELLVFLFMSGTVYLMGTLIDSSWTGIRGRLLGEYLRTTWGGALIIPLAFLFYLCVAWIAKSRIPRPLGQIFGTLQLYLSAAFMLGLFRQAKWDLAWTLAEPGRVGNGLAQFFVLNLGVLGTILVAFASLALAAILFGFRLPVRIIRAISVRFMEGKVPEREVRERARRSMAESASSAASSAAPAPSITIRELPRIEGGEPYLLSSENESVLASTPLDGLVMVGEELVDSTEYYPQESAVAEELPQEPESRPEAEETSEKDDEIVLREAPEEEIEAAFADFAAEPGHDEEAMDVLEPDIVVAEEKIPSASDPVFEKKKPQTAAEILEDLLASLEAEAPLVGGTDPSPPPETKTYRPPLPTKSAIDPEQIIEIQSPIRLTPDEQVLELKELLAPQKGEDEEKSSLPSDAASLLDGKGLSSAVQETFPDVELPEDEETVRLRAGLFPPPLDIFGPSAKDDEEDGTYDLASEQAQVIVDTLQNFGVKASVAHIVIGPSVIQFQLELAPGIKVSKVSGLANDLTMALAVVSVRVEAPILGQRYVGIEIPNPKRKGITLRSVMESEEFKESDYVLPLPMGVRVDSKHLICGLEDMPHLLVAGTTGSGKSVFTNTCILGMCSQRTPEELKLILVDPKHVEFAIYEGLPHLLARPVSDPKKAIAALSWAVQEMETRSEAFARAKVRNLASYNEKTLPKNRFPNIVVVVDELEIGRAHV